MSVDDALIERLAQAVHEHYLQEQISDGVPMGSTSAMSSWEDLDEDLREANRAQAREIETTLAQVGCRVEPGAGGAFALTSDEIELLARREHARWLRQRRDAGWIFGQIRDDAGRRHPRLVEWGQLSESERDKDRDAVRNFPSVLAAAGLRVVRT